MATSRLRPGDWGKIRTYQRGINKWLAVCQYCDDRGKVSQRSKTGRSRSAAIRALDEDLTRKQGIEIAPKLNGRTRLRELAELMFEEKRTLVAAGQMSPGSLRTYEGHWKLHLKSSLGDLAVEWVGVSRCDRHLKTLRKSKGYATARGVRSVLSEILATAIRNEAIRAPNPIEGCADIPGNGRKQVKALEAAEAVHIWRSLSELAVTPGKAVNNRRYRPTLCNPMVPDLWLWMLGTGDRISQALAARWPRIDMDIGVARLGPNVIRVPGQGLIINEGTSKSSEVEGVDLPEQIIAMLLVRQRLDSYQPMGLVFPGRRGGLLDPCNVSSKQLRPALQSIGYGHVSSHWCRRTLGTELDAAGLTLLEIAGRLRHADSRTTERHYVAKRGGNPRAKAAIEAMLATAPQRRVVELNRP